MARRLCDRVTGAGADGLLAVQRGFPEAVDVRYFNADGSAAFLRERCPLRGLVGISSGVGPAGRCAYDQRGGADGPGGRIGNA